MTENWLDGPVRFITSAPVRLFIWIALGKLLLEAIITFHRVKNGPQFPNIFSNTFSYKY